MSRRQSNGSAGEYAAEQWFKRHGWVMFRTQPEVTIVAHLADAMLKRVAAMLGLHKLAYWGHLVLCRVHAGGIADYTGYAMSTKHSTVSYAAYRACEVKEAHGDTMPASRLSAAQRAWMDTLPVGCAWVGILWVDYGTTEFYEYKRTGSYKRGAGVV